jgi:transcriptional regulator with XRE-family HTH domain
MSPAQLKHRRKQIGLSQSQLARALQVGVSSISQWETGRHNPSPLLPLALDSLDNRAEVTLRAGRLLGEVLKHLSDGLMALEQEDILTAKVALLTALSKFPTHNE